MLVVGGVVVVESVLGLGKKKVYTSTVFHCQTKHKNNNKTNNNKVEAYTFLPMLLAVCCFCCCYCRLAVVFVIGGVVVESLLGCVSLRLGCLRRVLLRPGLPAHP